MIYVNIQKEGLCWQHWKRLYSHSTGKNGKLKTCELCGESDLEILAMWETHCSYKIENPNWELIAEERRKAEQAQSIKEARDERLKQTPAKARKAIDNQKIVKPVRRTNNR